MRFVTIISARGGTRHNDALLLPTPVSMHPDSGLLFSVPPGKQSYLTIIYICTYIIGGILNRQIIDTSYNININNHVIFTDLKGFCQ